MLFRDQSQIQKSKPQPQATPKLQASVQTECPEAPEAPESSGTGQERGLGGGGGWES